MIDWLTTIVIIATGGFFLWLAAVSIFKPGLASRFLLGFAASAGKHYLELGIRIVVGAALLARAPHLPCSNLFSLFGWVLLATSIGLLLIPWQWHHRFAQKAVPQALRYVKLIGLVSLGLGLTLLLAVAHGSAG